MRARSLRELGKTDEAVTSLEQAICTNTQVKSSTLMALASEGNWSEADAPGQSTPAFEAVLRACMIDKDCN